MLRDGVNVCQRVDSSTSSAVHEQKELVLLRPIAPALTPMSHGSLCHNRQLGTLRRNPRSYGLSIHSVLRNSPCAHLLIQRVRRESGWKHFGSSH